MRNPSGSSPEEEDPPPDPRPGPFPPLFPRWLLVAAVAALWIVAWITQLDAAREANRYGLWTLTILATLWLVFRLLR